MVTAVEPLLGRFLKDNFPDSHVSVSEGLTGLTADSLILVSAIPIDIGGFGRAGKWTVDIVCLQVGPDIHEFAFKVQDRLRRALDDFTLSWVVSHRWLTLPQIVENQRSSRGHMAMRMSLDIVAYYDGPESLVES